MKKFKFKKINAFATEKSEGNPAGMVYLDDSDDISTFEMLQIAKELQGFVSEVGYIRQVNSTTFDLKYYSAEREVDFCGHATIAILYDLIKNSEKLLEKRYIYIRTNKGELEVENRIRQEDAVFISAPQPTFSKNKVNHESLATSLKIDINEIATTSPISIVNAGLETLIVPIKSLQGILSISPDIDELRIFCTLNNIDIITVFTPDVSNIENRFRTRVFASTFGYLEDPATGTGNSALGNYLIKNEMWDGALMSIEQNDTAENANIIKLMAKSTSTQEVQIVFGGGAIVKIEGEYVL